MNEAGIIRILKRECIQICKTGRAPRPGALPDWMELLNWFLNLKGTCYIKVAARCGKVKRVFYVDYQSLSENKTFSVWIDGVEYKE